MQNFITQNPDDETDETALANRLARFLHGDQHLASHCHGKFWCYDPGRGIFAPVTDAALRNLLFDLNGLTRPKNRPFKVNKGLAGRIVKILADRLLDQSFFDDSSPGVAVANGFFLALCGNVLELQDHTASNRARLFIPIPYDEQVDTALLDAFMAETLPDPELVELVFELAGVALFGQGTKRQVAAIFVGDGANGKGVITQLLEKLIPSDMRSAVSPSEWSTDFQRHKLDGSRLNTCGDLPHLNAVTWPWMKGIIAGDRTTARPVRGNQYELKPIAQHIFSTNRLPLVTEDGEAIRRRFRIVRFPIIVPPENRDSNLADELFEARASALLLRAVQGMERVVARGSIANPQACEIEMQRWLGKSDLIKAFVDECLELTGVPTDRVPSLQMYDAAVSHANRHGDSPPASRQELARKLEAHGLRRAKASSMFWIGVRLKNLAA